MQEKIIIGIDLAGVEKNPTGWALWKNKVVSACHIYDDQEISEHLTKLEPTIIAIDAPLSLPKKGTMRRADREMYRYGYPVFPPRSPTMEKLALRAIKITQQVKREEFRIIEVHPASTRKALKIPTKNRKRIQDIFLRMGLKGDLETLVLTSHEIDAVTAALTGYLHLQEKTELIGDVEEGYIVVPTKGNWRRLKL